MVIELSAPDIASIRDLIACGLAAPNEPVEECLSRIEKWNGSLHAFTQVDATAAVNSTAAVCQRNAVVGPLHGIPIAVKDVIDVEGLKTSANSRNGHPHPAEGDALVVGRLRAAGAIIVGKTTTWEFGIGETSDTGAFARARNPWDLNREAGGSSSGSAVAVAAGQALGAVGTDTGGSVRSPASWCGIVGFKPTRDLVPLHGVLPLAPSLDCLGFMGRTVADVDLLFSLAAGEKYCRQLGERLADMLKKPRPLEGIRLAVWRAALADSFGLNDEVKSNFLSVIGVLESAGATLVEPSLSSLAAYNAACFILARSESFEYYRDRLIDREWRGRLGQSARARLLLGGLLSSAEVDHAAAWRSRLTHEAETMLKACDAVLMPSMHIPAPTFGDPGSIVGSTEPLFVRFASLTGQPSLTLPSGASADGMPLGLLINGEHNGDHRLLELSSVIEAVLGRSLPAASFKGPADIHP